MTVFEVLHNADNIEGRGPMVHVAYFTHAIDANRAAKGNGVMGVGDDDVKRVELRVFDSFNEYYDVLSEGNRKSGLAKLTRAEKVALGLENE